MTLGQDRRKDNVRAIEDFAEGAKQASDLIKAHPPVEGHGPTLWLAVVGNVVCPAVYNYFLEVLKALCL